MSKLSLKFLSFIFFSLSSLVRLQNITDKPPRSTSTTTEKIDYISLEPEIRCKFQPNGNDCDGSAKKYSKFYYDLKLEDCKTYNIGTCPHNLNAYDTLSDCHNECRDIGTRTINRNLSVRIFCRFQHDFGYCNEYHPSWYYDVTTKRCKGFSYSGCGGNMNRFKTQQACITSCSSVIKTRI